MMEKLAMDITKIATLGGIGAASVEAVSQIPIQPEMIKLILQAIIAIASVVGIWKKTKRAKKPVVDKKEVPKSKAPE